MALLIKDDVGRDCPRAQTFRVAAVAVPRLSTRLVGRRRSVAYDIYAGWSSSTSVTRDAMVILWNTVKITGIG
jgi:hypothetical protein